MSSNSFTKMVPVNGHSFEETARAPVLSGQSSEEEVRRRQMAQYSQDKVKFQQKEKEKAEKKRLEKLEKYYSHINTGQRLSVDGPTGSSDPSHARTSSQSTIDNQRALREQKEKEFREQMKKRRELMQEQYNQIAESDSIPK